MVQSHSSSGRLIFKQHNADANQTRVDAAQQFLAQNHTSCQVHGGPRMPSLVITSCISHLSVATQMHIKQVMPNAFKWHYMVHLLSQMLVLADAAMVLTTRREDLDKLNTHSVLDRESLLGQLIISCKPATMLWRAEILLGRAVGISLWTGIITKS